MIKHKFIISETNEVQCRREAYHFSGTLTQAKRHASKNKMYIGTVLKIESESGELIASKSGKKWKDNNSIVESFLDQALP